MAITSQEVANMLISTRSQQGLGQRFRVLRPQGNGSELNAINLGAHGEHASHSVEKSGLEQKRDLVKMQRRTKQLVAFKS